MFRPALLLCVLASLCASPAFAAVPALPEDQKAIFWGSPEDKPAEKLLGITEDFVGRHYITGDEWNPQLWLPFIKDLGGGYIGVGSDQAYLFLGWVKPDFAWFIDYDPMVVALHAVYRAFLLESDTPDAFLRLWAPANQNEALDRITHYYPNDSRLKLYKELYTRNRGNIHYRLTLLRKKLDKDKVVNYLSDPATYTFVRDMVRSGRVRPMSANLLESKGIVGIGEAAKKLGVTIHALYLSNAEEYWPYGAQFRTNIRSLPFDAKTRIIRTLSSFSVNKDYRYNTQPGLLYQAWLERPTLHGVRQMVVRRKLTGPDDVEISETTTDPAEIGKKGKKKP